MGNAIRGNLEASSIQMDSMPGQARWEIGGIERPFGPVKGLMTALARECPGRSCEEYLARAMATYNDFDRRRDFSPLQAALGRTPDLDGSFMDAPGRPGELAEDGVGGRGRQVRVERQVHAPGAGGPPQVNMRRAREEGEPFQVSKAPGACAGHAGLLLQVPE